MKLPFKVGKPVEDKYFIDRTNEINELLKHINAMSNVCLLGMRRMGKTSLLYKIAKKLQDPIPVYVNCYGIPDKKRYAALYTDSVRDACIKYTSRWELYVRYCGLS